MDTQSERLVQRALEAASVNRTTIVIAHRLSTIRNADLICVMQHGDLVEQGTHNQLLALGGVYADLVKRQEIATNQDHKTLSGLDDDETIDAKHISTFRQQYGEVEEDVDSTLDEKESPFELVRMGTMSSVDAYELKRRKEKAERKALMKQHAPIGKILRQMRPEWHLLFIGSVCALVAGAVFPMFVFVVSKAFASLLGDKSEIAPGPMEGANRYAFLFSICGIAALLSNFGRTMALETAAERYTERLRKAIFRAYLKQEIGFFDEDENNVGSLTSKLALDSKNVNEMVTKVWSDMMFIAAAAATGVFTAIGVIRIV